MKVVKNLFGAKAQFVSSVNGRVLEASKLYNNPMSLLVFQKLFHAYAIRKHKKSIAFLAGGVYHGCKNAGSHARDSLFMKDGNSKNKWNKVDDFRAFSLVTNKVFVSPQTMATHLYKFMGYGTVRDNTPLRELKQQITLWKGANKMPYIEVKDVYGGEVGVGVEGGGGSANKKLTKQSFTDPMRKLTTSLESLHDALKDENCDLASKRLTKDVTGAFDKIAQLVSFNERPSYGSDDNNDEEQDNGKTRAVKLRKRVMQMKTLKSQKWVGRTKAARAAKAAVVTTMTVKPLNSQICVKNLYTLCRCDVSIQCL